MNDIDRKVKEETDGFIRLCNGLVDEGPTDVEIEAFANRIKIICQENAERREEEAFEASRKPMDNPPAFLRKIMESPPVVYEYRDFAAYKQSREGQEGDKG